MTYTPDDYDQYNVLKIPAGLGLLLMYLLKYPILLLLSKLPKAGDMTIITQFVYQHMNLGVLLASIPAALVVYAMSQRIPTGNSFARWLWRRGWVLLLLSLLFQLASPLAYILLGKSQFSDAVLVFGYLDAMFLLYMWRSRRLRDVFLEFPTLESVKAAAEAAALKTRKPVEP
jgi:hypothetical protein